MESVILPPEREVECECDVRFHRPVFRDHTGINERVSACLHCGTVTYTESLVEEPRPHDVRCVGNRLLEIAPNALAWLDQWCRLAWGVWQNDRQIYLSPSLRCETVTELESREQEALSAQRNFPYRERLLIAGLPKEPAPPELPEKLRSFAQTWQGLRLSAETDVETLLDSAKITNWAAPFARELLSQRPQIVEEITQLILSPSSEKLQVGLDMAERRLPCEPRIVAAVLLRLRSIGIHDRDLYALLNAVRVINNTSPEVRSILNDLAEKIGDKDYYLRKHVEQIRDTLFPKPIRRKEK